MLPKYCNTFHDMSVLYISAYSLVRHYIRRHACILTRFERLVPILFCTKAMFIDLVLTSVQVTLGSTMYSKTVTKFSQSLQLDCLLKVSASAGMEIEPSNISISQEERWRMLRSDADGLGKEKHCRCHRACSSIYQHTRQATL